ncbi:hypothetical protein TA3x_001973 [Tundrisphaera sp. TA3]|uniref:hypothetical protein n=1 Tax=Tundrisphaera sp. TA3 TaxID=3435775 RepID=UPI003EBA3E01
MTRMKWNLVLAAAVASGVVGCAQCDTCDDFPAPCTGPNCGHEHAPMGYAAPTMAYSAPATGIPAGQPGLAPAADDDAAGPAPAVPSPTTPPAPETTSPPAPMDPSA